jgi:hypothetical protein
LKRLLKINAPSVLNREVLPSPTVGALPQTELDVARDALAGMGVVRIAAREFRLPGLQRHSDVILKALADFKAKKQRNYVPLPFAKADDIVMEPLRPEVFDITGFLKDNWRQAGLAVGIRDIIPDVIQTAGIAPATTFTLDDDELIIITDWVEFQTTPIISALQCTVDGTTYQPEEIRVMMMTDLQLHELNWPLIADVNIDINAKVEFGPLTAELVPFGVHICVGRLLAALT